jgi:RHH-type proline utilization regulon transcriptional repressor/proline dehydrogenase/delta 1-pyrroline-5-carboxylate dehydrogenase
VVLAHAGIAGELRTRLAGAIATLRVGPAEDFATDVPPVIDAASQERVRRAIATGESTGALAATASDVPEDGHFVAPSLFAGLPAGSPLVEDEIFGPVLAMVEVASIEEALDHVQRSRFALTGGLFSRSPRVVAEVARRSPVGNLYVNREITGAMVGRQPFGGNRLSGIGAKTGGPDYLLQFAEVRVVTENTIRHGLVV